MLLFSVSVFSQIPEELLSRRFIKFLQKETLFDPVADWEKLSVGNENENGCFYVAGKNSSNYLYLGRVNTCRSGGCNADASATGFEYFDYAILFNDSPMILKVFIINYESSRGYEICSKHWLQQFELYDGESTVSVGDDIDAISGATVSVLAITNDIMMQIKTLKEWIRLNES